VTPRIFQSVKAMNSITGRSVAVDLCSDADKIRKSYKRCSNCNQKHGVGNEIRENHEGQSAHQRDRCLLPSAVYEEAKPDGTENHTPKEPPCAHCSLTSD
jgi:hypothetical protein